MNRLVLFGLILVCAFWQAKTLSADELQSPNGKVVARVFMTEAGALQYDIRWKGQPIIESSRLGITVDGIDLGSKVTIGVPSTKSCDETYETRGVHTQARNHYTQWTFPLTHQPSGRNWSLACRVFDDGVAFRYLVSASDKQHVDGESTSWRIVEGCKAWYFERLAKKWKLKSYAGEWLSTDAGNLHTVSPPGPIQGTPIVLELPQQLGYAAITKAATYNYSGMRLRGVGDRTLVADFTEGDAGFDVDGPIVTPWRVTMLADDLNELVNSDLIKNLNPAPDLMLFGDADFVKPGRTAWSWETLSLGTPDTQREFIDLAAEMGFEYSTVDDGWKDWPDPWGTIKSLCDHGKSKNVGVWVWVHSKDIMDPTNNYRQMREYFDRVAAAGCVGLKIDFMNGESKELINFETAVLRNSAWKKLMINFHGCHASTGEERTYPNEMTREGIRGIEVNKMKEGPLPASHNAALPFTRFVVGHADYTPVLFSNPGPTTWAHQVATLVTFTSALQTYAEHPDTMMRSPILKKAFPIVKTIPPIWDETRVLLGSEIGKLTVMARRSGDVWFIGILNGEQIAKDYSLDLSFLGDENLAIAAISDDTTSPRVNLVGLNAKADLHEFTTAIPLKVEQRSLKQERKLSVKLAPGGGFVARLTKQ